MMIPNQSLYNCSTTKSITK